MMRRVRVVVPALLAAGIVAVGASTEAGATPKGVASSTPIKHLVVIFQENVSFDHYFGTYPVAANSDGQTFVAAPGTPSVNGLTPALLSSNPNLSNPKRLDTSVNGPGGNGNGLLTCDQDHNYSDEQQAFDGGKMDQFVQSVGTDGSTHAPGGALCDPKTVMDYYDGNAVTAFWNYAQHFALSDNSFSPTFGPSAPGAINLVSGDTGGVDMTHTVNSPSIATSSKPNADLTADGLGGYSLTSDAQPYWDDCSTRDAVALGGTNIGDELNAAGLSWGWFQGGERPTTPYATAIQAPEVTAVHPNQTTAQFFPDEFAGSFTGKVVPPHAPNQGLCDAVHPVGVALGGSGQWGYKDDYIAHHEPFNFYASTANPHHLTIPTDSTGHDTLAGLGTIGTDTQSYVNGVPQFNTPNHQYDVGDFDQLVAAIAAGTLPASALPAVSFLKAPGYEDGHAAYSDPADEQQFVVSEIDALMKTPDWSSTAVVIAYDDSDGFYDHVDAGVVNPSLSPADNLTNTALGKITAANPTSQQCGPSPQTSAPLAGEQGRCGFGPRMPLLVISPWARQNAVDHDLSDLASIPNFVEYNWGLPAIPGSFDQALSGLDASEGVPFDLAGLFDFSRQNPLGTLPLSPTTGQIDLAGAALSGENLKGADLSGAQAGGASLDGVNLKGAFLVNIDLHGSNLRGTNLMGADLAGANLQGATLSGTNLKGADLTGANLTGAELQGANLDGVTWSNTTCPDGTSSSADGGSCVGHL